MPEENLQKIDIIVAFLLLAGFMQPLTVFAAPHENAHRGDMIAHRGASGYAPENTMAAFYKCANDQRWTPRRHSPHDC